MSRVQAVMLIAIAAAGVGCTGEQGIASTASVRDSAGIIIVENENARWSEAEHWVLSSEPAVEIGVFEGATEYMFFQAREPKRLSDGRIVVANAGNELRYYDAEGVYLHTVGREGEGPGEFRQIVVMQRFAGDSIMAYDGAQRRASLFDAEGNFDRVVVMNPDAGRMFFMFRAVRLPDGSFLGEAPTFTLPGAGATEIPERDSVVLIHASAEGSVIDTLGTHPNMKRDIKTREFQGRSFPIPVTQPFTPMTMVAVHDDKVFVGTSDTYEIQVYALDGTLGRLIRKDHTPVKVTEEMQQSFRERLESALSGNPQAAPFIELYDDIPYPETTPAYSQIRVDELGYLWVQQYPEDDDDPMVWSVFDPEGEFLGTVNMPPRFVVSQIGSDYVLGMWTDDVEVQYVRMYDLTKGGTSE